MEYLEGYHEEDSKTLGVAFKVDANNTTEIWALLVSKNAQGRVILPEGISFVNITEKAAELKEIKGKIRKQLKLVKGGLLSQE
jgi:hypothetical protein